MDLGLRRKGVETGKMSRRKTRSMEWPSVRNERLKNINYGGRTIVRSLWCPASHAECYLKRGGNTVAEIVEARDGNPDAAHWS